MALNFPANPVLNDTYTAGNVTWIWNGEAWLIAPPSEVEYETLNITGDTTLNNLSVTGTFSLPLGGLSNVSATTPNDQDVLQYDEATEEWIPAAPASGGGGGGEIFNGGTISNPLFINNITGSTDYNSGALRVGGGASIAENLFIAGTLVVQDESIDLRARSSLRLYTSDNNNYVALKGPDSASDVTYVLPGTDGSAGQYLRTNGAGTLSWATVTGGGEGGVTNPGGISGQVQFNDSGLFEGDSNLTYDAGTSTLTTVNITASGDIVLSGSTQSTSSTTGTVTVGGGIGIAGNLNVAGPNNSFSGNTSSTSINTGTIVVTGGMGISGKVHVGDTVSTSAAPTETDHLTNKKYVDANVLAFSVAFGA
jgi:hypothetical protein